MTTKAQKQEREEALADLRQELPPGTTVYTLLRHVSASGMSRNIDVYVMRDNAPRNISYRVAQVLQAPRAKDGSIKVGGAGMDMGFHIVHNLGYALYPDGFECIGEGCPSNDHFNRCPDKWHKYGGYAFNHRWL